MTLSVALTRQAQIRLKQRAAAAGQDPAAYATDLLERAVTRPSLQELLAPSQAEFAQTGKTRAQIMAMGRRIVQRVRAKQGK